MLGVEAAQWKLGFRHTLRNSLIPVMPAALPIDGVLEVLGGANADRKQNIVDETQLSGDGIGYAAGEKDRRSSAGSSLKR